MALDSPKKLNVLYCIILKAFIDMGYYPKLVLQHFYGFIFTFVVFALWQGKVFVLFLYAKKMLSGFSAGHDWLTNIL
jgi:hypothetical protein